MPQATPHRTNLSDWHLMIDECPQVERSETQLIRQTHGIITDCIEIDPVDDIYGRVVVVDGEQLQAVARNREDDHLWDKLRETADTRPENGSTSVGMVPRVGGFVPNKVSVLTPPWITEADVDFYEGEFKASGFRGGLNWYRNIDRNWELLAPWAGAKVAVPSLYMVGDRDLVMRFPGMDQLLANLNKFVPDLQGMTILPGCGHWTQQERPGEVNSAVIRFLDKLRAR